MKVNVVNIVVRLLTLGINIKYMFNNGYMNMNDKRNHVGVADGQGNAVQMVRNTK